MYRWIDSWVPDLMSATTSEDREQAVYALLSSLPHDAATDEHHSVATIPGWIDLR